MLHCMLQNGQISQEIIETSARIDMHFDKIMTYFNQPISTPIPNQTQKFHQCYQVNQLHISLESTLYVDTNFESMPSLFYLNQIKEFEQNAENIHEQDTTPCHEPPIE